MQNDSVRSTTAGQAPTPPDAHTQKARRESRFAWHLRDIMLVVVLGVIAGFLYWALVQGSLVLQIVAGPLGDFTQHVLFGGWLIVAPVAVAIVRRPFAGVIAETIGGAVEVVFLGSPSGALLILIAALQGAGSELPFAASRYRRYGWMTYAFSGGIGALGAFLFSALRSGWFGTDLFWARLVIQVISGIVIGGIAAKIVVDAASRTGVVDNFAIGRDRASHTAGSAR